LKEGRKSCVLVVRNLGTWPVTAEIKEKKGRGCWFLKIDLKY